MDGAKNGDLTVWWIPQIGIKAKPFRVPVTSVHDGALLIDALAKYDLYQFENRIKPDYANIGGLEVYEADSDGDGTPGWCSWMDEETGIDDPAEYVEHLAAKARGEA